MQRAFTLIAIVLLLGCKRDPALQMVEAPQELQRCIPAGDVYGSVVEVRFGADGRGAPTHACFSTSHDAACIRQYIVRASRGDAGTMKRMLISRSQIVRPSGATLIGKVTYGEVGSRPINVLGGPCAMRPL